MDKKSPSPPSLDIRQVIQKSTSEVTVSELSKKGFKQVKVLNQAMITRLIAEAVDRAIQSRFDEISQAERDKVIEESATQFEAILRDRLQKERDELEKVRHESEEVLRGRSKLLMETQAQRDGAQKRIEELENALQTALQQVERSIKSQATDKEQLERILEELKSKQAELEEMEEALKERDEVIEELKRKLEAAGSAPQPTQVEGLMMALLSKLKDGPAGGGGGSPDLNKLQNSIEGLVEKVSRLGGSKSDLEIVDKEVILERLFSAEGGEKLESNVNDVKVKEAKAGGVKNTLAKLKSLQKGGLKDGE